MVPFLLGYGRIPTTNGVTISGDAVVNGNLTAANYDNKSSIASSITINGGKINGELKKRNIDRCS